MIVSTTYNTQKQAEKERGRNSRAVEEQNADRGEGEAVSQYRVGCVSESDRRNC